MSHLAIIAVGSNIEPERHVERARRLLSREHELVAESTWRWTAPVGISDQPDFLNGALLVRTELDEDAFRGYLKEVESRLGRDRSGPKFGPRVIDLDLVVWERRVVHRDYPAQTHTREPVDELLGAYEIDLAEAP